jgi:transcription elongation factor Elf1
MANTDYIKGDGEEAKELISWLSSLEQTKSIKELIKEAEFSLGSLTRGKLIYVGANKEVYDLLNKCPLDFVKEEMQYHCVHEINNEDVVVCGSCEGRFKILQKYKHYLTCPYCESTGWVVKSNVPASDI